MTATSETGETARSQNPGSPGGSTSNTAEHNSGVQSENFNGDYNIFNWYAESKQPPLKDRQVSETEIARARDHFVPCPGFEEAQATLERSRVLFLRNTGTGRSLASVRLLTKCAVASISCLSERRSFDSLADSDLEPGGGYIWQGLDREWHEQITPASVDRVATWALKQHSFVVVIVDHRVEVDLRKYTERLGKPDPVQVALSVLRSQHGLAADTAEKVLDAEFREQLTSTSAPNDAEFVAIRAWEVHRGDRDKEQAIADASSDLRTSVARWFLEVDKRSPIEYAMLVAIAVFEGREYDDVVQLAEDLENMIYKRDSGKDVESRKIFEFSKTVILFRLNAAVTPHQDTDGSGFPREAVHFRRSDWAREAFRRAWSEYDLFRPVLVDWMAKQAKLGFQWYCAKALHDVLVNVPHSEPLAHIGALAAKQSRHANELAAELVGRLARDDRTKHVVEPTLLEWCDGDRDFHRKWTAASVYATEYGRRQPDTALRELEKIARTNANLNSAVNAAIISLLDEPANRTKVLQTLVQWTGVRAIDTDSMEQGANLRAIGLDCAQAVLGLMHGTSYLRSIRAGGSFGDPDTRLVAKLFGRLFQDQNKRAESLHALLELSARSAADPTSDEAVGFAQLLFAVVPELERARALFQHWKKVFPGNTQRINRAFVTLKNLYRRFGLAPEQ
ncbi:hypothetical protein GCM10027271_45840 [Saccharopolyspora gloriosae]|uniref:Uncharacterized protein n=1 Tax=Saccharopolyspora gloriosae TaxID=455344 RepID=A0A840NET6_9PSEU|nr:hypothetical protein [Saccharopolyspora gloriosae]MBB5070114.1 hypothetical protein [Saccharopolyspora gloriosae]